MVVTAQGPDPDSPADPRFGRARYLIVLEDGASGHAAIDNQINLNAAQGAGIQTARKVVELGAQAVLTGHVGPKAFHALRSAGVAVYTGAAGTVRQTVERFRAGQLVQASSADVEGHSS